MSVELLTKPTKFEKGEQVVEAIASIVERVNTLTARNTVSPDDIQPIKDELKEIASAVRGLQPKVDALSRESVTVATSTLETFPVAEVWEPEPGMAAEHFNLLVRSPEELSISASISGGTKVKHTTELANRIRDFQAMSDTVYLVDEFMAMNEEYRNIGDRPKRMRTLRCWKAYARLAEEMKAAAGTMFDTQTTDQGAEWVPTMFSSLLHDRIRASLLVASQFETIPMPSASYKSPVMGADMKAYKVAESTEENALARPTSRTFTTKQMTLTAKKLGVRVLMSHEVDEDSIISIVPKILSEMARALAYGRDDCILNGDTTATHMDADVTASDDARKTWKGLRQYALATGITTDALAGPLKIREHWQDLRKQMGRYGRPNECVAFAGHIGVAELLLIKDDAGNNAVLTVDKYGDGAAIRSGEIGRILGVPILLSDAVREDVDSTGVNSGGPNDTAVIQLVHTPSFANGERRTATVKRLGELYAEYDADAFVGFWRGDFAPWFDMTTENAAGLIINVK